MKDLSNVTGTYTNCLLEHKKELTEMCTKLGKFQIDIPTFKENIFSFIASAHDTPAKNRFIQTINRQNDRSQLVYCVYNAIAAGMNVPVIK